MTCTFFRDYSNFIACRPKNSHVAHTFSRLAAGRTCRACAPITLYITVAVGVAACFHTGGVAAVRPSHVMGRENAQRVDTGFPFGNNLTKEQAVRIAVTMPITSRHDAEGGVEGMRLFSSFLPSFLATAFPTDFPCIFEFWFAYDVGDSLLDSDQGKDAFEKLFMQRTSKWNTSSKCGNHTTAEAGSGNGSGCIRLHMRRFRHSHTLTALWNGLNEAAYDALWNGLNEAAYNEGCHYFFMANDDLLMQTAGWPSGFLHTLAASPLYPNLGVTGPMDPVSGRGDMPSMPLIHRTHLEIFAGLSLPASFQNWYNDIWLGNVYRPFGACLLVRTIRARNHHGCKDAANCSRYHLGQGGTAPWREETLEGRARVVLWLRSPARAVALNLAIQRLGAHTEISSSPGPRLDTSSPSDASFSDTASLFHTAASSLPSPIFNGKNVHDVVAAPITLG